MATADVSENSKFPLKRNWILSKKNLRLDLAKIQIFR